MYKNAKFWVGAGPSPSPQGIRVPDENGKEQPLRRYDRKTIVLTLPGDLTVHQIGHFGVWCEAFTVDFGHIQIPQGLNVPPSLKMLGVSPQNVHRGGQGQTGVLDLQNLHDSISSSIFSPATSSSSSTLSATYTPSLIAQQQQQQQQHQQQHHHQRPTTYRPILRRDDQIQVVQAVDYRIPKSLQVPEALPRQQHPVQPASFQYHEDIANLGRLRQLANVQTSDDSSYQHYRHQDGGSSSSSTPSSSSSFSSSLSSGSPRQQSGRARTRTHQPDPQQNSYSRLLRYQGDHTQTHHHNDQHSIVSLEYVHEMTVCLQSKLNCEVLDDTLAFELRWAVAGDSIVVQLVGKLEAGQYMAFGLSANPERSVMIGGDVVVAWVDKQTLQGYAIDYFLDAKSQCSGGRGSCPDTKIQEDTNSVRLLNAALVNGYSIVTYQRPLKASDELDRQVLTNRSQAIIWAVGPLNERQEVSFHSDYLKTDRFIEFGRPPAWNCPIPDQEQPDTYTDNDNNANSNQQLAVTTRRPQRVPATPAPAPTNDAWEIPPIQCYEPEDGVFYAQMGPTGGKHGYPAITGHVGWGISWYINGLLIPEINVVRGKKYTFVVEGGQNADTPARYHPFYITDDPVGGYQHKTPEEKAKIKIFAGVRRQRGSIRPTGVGRFCYWVPDQKQPPADEFTSFGAYQRTLTLECDHGEPGIVEWTPDENTPDTVYYQCFTHRYLGWKINVHDSCDEGSASENHEVYVEPKGHPELIEDLDVSPSIRVSSKVTPTAEFLQQHLHHPHHREHGLRYPHHTATNSGKLSTSYAQLLTNANHNNYERFRTSAIHEDAYGPRSNHGIIPHRYEVRVKENYRHAHLDEEALQRQQQQQQKQQQTASSIYSELGGIGTVNRPTSISSTSATITSTALSSYPSRPQFTEIDQEIRQSSNHQLSNLVADNPRPLSHGMKFAYTLPTTQIVYSRPTSHHYSPDHHHLHHLLHYHQHQPEQQRAQVMIVRRPVLMRRPILQSSHTITSPTFALPPSRSIFMERKKAVYKVPTSEKVSYGNIVKLMKLDPKQRSKLEAKVSEAGIMDISENLMTSLKPARNTGFNPDSIIIEGGFKPIIDPSRDFLQKRISESDQEYDQETIKESNFSDQLSGENFEPVFLPSPSMSPASDGSKKQKKKPTPTNVNHSSKPPLDELDDMQMAADGLQSYYLPPARSEAESATPGVLITYDGKKVKDSSLARSISEIEDRSKARLTSDVLSRTPQFGRFKGELPPLISTEIRSSDKTTRLERNEQSPSLDLPLLKSRKNTKLTLVERSKRSPEETRTMSSTEFRRSNVTKSTPNEEDVDDITTLGSTGQTILANIKYVVLTIILRLIVIGSPNDDGAGRSLLVSCPSEGSNGAQIQFACHSRPPVGS
ncbi:hypothetical protein HZH68_002466 [Vespula germanica]|uniref:DOMON domain-containing protein n=1 Tax=Vespula germanica TaxID=30212 RepID=A0A834NMC1_VESGE|nr:hypothetical protein HZH68_002466 [Vespula germanica]